MTRGWGFTFFTWDPLILTADLPNSRPDPIKSCCRMPLDSLENPAIPPKPNGIDDGFPSNFPNYGVNRFPTEFSDEPVDFSIPRLISFRNHTPASTLLSSKGS